MKMLYFSLFFHENAFISTNKITSDSSNKNKKSKNKHKSERHSTPNRGEPRKYDSSSTIRLKKEIAKWQYHFKRKNKNRK